MALLLKLIIATHFKQEMVKWPLLIRIIIQDHTGPQEDKESQVNMVQSLIFEINTAK